MKNNEYWQKRFELLEIAQLNKGIRYYNSLMREYDKALEGIEKAISVWYMRFAKGEGISYAEAKKRLTKGELMSLREFVKKARQKNISDELRKELDRVSARVHISRLEALQFQIKWYIENMFAEELNGMQDLLGEVYSDGYYHAAYEIQKGLGFAWELDPVKVEKILLRPWAPDGMNFSKRIWGKHRPQLVSFLQTELAQSAIRGEPPQEVINKAAKKFKTARRNAANLIMTETAYFSSAAEQDCYKELGVEEYVIVATLDYKTSEICREMDGKAFKRSDYKIGTTAPPFHVRCRTVTAPYFNDEFTVDNMRAARDKDGKTYLVPANMSYKEWEKKYVKDVVKDSDRKLYEKYKGILGNNIPSLEKFKEIRYNNLNWNEFKSYTSSIRSGELSALVDFNLYKNISREVSEKLLGIMTSNNILISGRSKHFIARVIGSVEQRRNGVQISDILDALTGGESEIFPAKQMKNNRSQKFRNKVVEVSVNPDTGNIIQVNPIHRGKRGKL